ncbi:hypothetical protein [Pseudoalteromonas byunsanensis]|uniref:Uncharacterized protein n=1 Tax=Pseudoalteromonas byunsanensis TaxID=327939 RepID=A0A1S1N6S8_9GAMM|nr:hypothetical protein [Pseudoalteromonas byunsanensis]OHU94362.1 hypothetical protein BIW53_14885 [Pseudoalteromonas byunsanensis]
MTINCCISGLAVMDNLNLPSGSSSKLSNLRKNIKLRYGQFSAFWQALNLAQKLYLTALVILPFCLDNLISVMVMALAGFATDFWPRLIKLWETLVGKALILLFYAGVTNFAVASAESLVNEVLKVSAGNLAYTLNLSILLHLPIWVLACTIIALLLLQLILPFYMLVIIMLKPFKHTGVSVVSRKSYPVTTTVIQLFLISLIFIKLIMWMANSSGIRPEIHLGLGDSPNSFGLIVEDPAIGELQSDVLQLSESVVLHHSFEKLDWREHLKINAYIQTVKQLIADFAFHYEGSTYSRCAKSIDSSVVELNDYEILEIIPDSTLENGYSFTVKRCTSPAFPAS